MNEPNLREVIERHRATVMQSNGVVGIAVGLSKTEPGKRCIQVYVTTEGWPDGVPHQFDGCDVEVVKTSGVRAL
ncbi:MAG TPA: hypothetical protein VJA21_32520 [Verrucomicrobiae bacterium]